LGASLAASRDSVLIGKYAREKPPNRGVSELGCNNLPLPGPMQLPFSFRSIQTLTFFSHILTLPH